MITCKLYVVDDIDIFARDTVNDKYISYQLR